MANRGTYIFEENWSNADCIFRFREVKQAVAHLKAHTNDGSAGITSGHVIYAGDDCSVHLALLFSAIVVHGTVPDSLLYSASVPIPKGKQGNASDSS